MDGIDLSWSILEDRECLCIRGLPHTGDPADRLAVFTADALREAADTDALQPVAGDFASSGDAMLFVPRFPFVDGLAYSLVVAPQSPSDVPTVLTLQRPTRRRQATTQVVAIYPTASVVPLNLLRIYVYFSAPMSEHWAARAVQATRVEDGAPIPDVFYRGAELWDRTHERLTLLLDPGRIKRGLRPHEETGYPLTEGISFAVRIDEVFRDAAGLPLRAGSERRYEVGPALRSRVDPTAWRLGAPAAGSVEPLVLGFGRSLDHALLERCLSVATVAGAEIPGRFEPGPGETSVSFRPVQPWGQVPHALIIDALLEDVAGNSTTRVFDRDVTRRDDDPAPPPAPLLFTPRRELQRDEHHDS